MSSTSIIQMPSSAPDQLTPKQEAQVQNQADQIMDIVMNLPHNEKFIPHAIDNILTEEQWNFLDNYLKHHCIQLCIRAKVICKKSQKANPKAMGSLYWGEDGNPQTQNGMNASGRNASVPKWDVIPASHFQGPGDPRLSQLIYCFQHYANAAENRIANPEFVQNPPTNHFSVNVATRNGVLDANTMRQLEYLVQSSGFKKVSAGSSDLHLPRQIFGAKLVCSLSWEGLDNKFHALRPTIVNSLANDNRFSSILSANSLDPNVLDILSISPNSLPSGVSSIATQIQDQARTARELAQRSSSMLQQGASAARSNLQPINVPQQRSSIVPPVVQQVARTTPLTPRSSNANVQYTPSAIPSMDPRRRGF